jgi:hypothetical protein
MFAKTHGSQINNFLDTGSFILDHLNVPIIIWGFKGEVGVRECTRQVFKAYVAAK